MSIEDLKDKRYGKVGTKSRSDAEERLQLEKIGILLKEKIDQLERENQYLKERNKELSNMIQNIIDSINAGMDKNDIKTLLRQLLLKTK